MIEALGCALAFAAFLLLVYMAETLDRPWRG